MKRRNGNIGNPADTWRKKYMDEVGETVRLKEALKSAENHLAHALDAGNELRVRLNHALAVQMQIDEGRAQAIRERNMQLQWHAALRNNMTKARELWRTAGARMSQTPIEVDGQWWFLYRVRLDLYGELMNQFEKMLKGDS